MLFRFLARLYRDDAGTTSTEHIILVSIIALSLVGVGATLGDRLSDFFDGFAAAITAANGGGN